MKKNLLDSESLDKECGYEVAIYRGKLIYRGASTGWCWFPASRISHIKKLLEDSKLRIKDIDEVH